MKLAFISLFVLLAACTAPDDNPVLIATASSFRPALEMLAPALNDKCNTNIQISSGSTGALVTQIRQGAPFGLLISADQNLSKQLVSSSAKSYRLNAAFARSPMAYWQPKPLTKKLTIAIANPKTAPFGKAAMQVIADSNPDLVIASNAGQAFVFVHTRAANAGYVPLPLLIAAEIPDTEYKLIDKNTYSPIFLHNVRLRNNPVLDCLADQLNATQTMTRLAEFGYLPP
ncbi:MAG: molybdate ABC transporter substrate-binding protein [Robiginitomaculum sp.]|nr:molybdate ABC transporter substrate-binding protein [Robiginitomaculum sp.]